jgi:hypothetical protein
VADVYGAVDALRERYGSVASEHPDVAGGATPRRRMHGGSGLLPGDRVEDRPDGLSPAGSFSTIVAGSHRPLQDEGCALPDQRDLLSTIRARTTPSAGACLAPAKVRALASSSPSTAGRANTSTGMTTTAFQTMTATTQNHPAKGFCRIVNHLGTMHQGARSTVASRYDRVSFWILEAFRKASTCRWIAAAQRPAGDLAVGGPVECRDRRR